MNFSKCLIILHLCYVQMLKKHFGFFPKSMLKEASSSISLFSSVLYLVSGAAGSADVLKPSPLICSGEEWSSMSRRNLWPSKVAVNRIDYLFQQLSKKTFIIFLLLLADKFLLSVSF